MQTPVRSAPPGEPDAHLASRRVLKWFLATRPAFLAVTAGGVVVGWGAAAHDGVAFRPWAALATVLLALLAHAAANVVNDWADALNGTDALNVDRVFPFTGGSRFIQNGVLTAAQTRRFALLLATATMAGGVALVADTGPVLFWVGAAGMAVGPVTTRLLASRRVCPAPSPANRPPPLASSASAASASRRSA